MLFKWRKLARHLEKHGRRVPATVVEIAKHGMDYRAEGMAIEDLIPSRGGDSLAPKNSGGYAVREARIRIEPPDGEAIEIEGKFRFGDWGRYVPKAGEKLEVVYDPNDPEKLMVAPPTPEEEQARTLEALSKADVGFTVGGGTRGTGKPVSDEQMAQHQQAMDQAEQMLQQAQQFMSGGAQPGQAPPADPAGEEDEEQDK